MKNKFLILSLGVFMILFFSYCSNKNSTTEQNEKPKVYYFDFDEADHYCTEITEQELDKIGGYKVAYDTTNLDDQLLLDIVHLGVPKDISDTSFLSRIEKIGFTKNEVPKNKLKELNEIFCERTADPNDVYAMCMPTYRDVIIFRKNSKICGMAKICFGCDILSTRGTEAETKYFGSYKGFERLRALLYEKD